MLRSRLIGTVGYAVHGGNVHCRHLLGGRWPAIEAISLRIGRGGSRGQRHHRRRGRAAGGRHEVEAYVVAFRVVGLPTGLYHYNPEVNALELLRCDFDQRLVAHLTYGQEQCSSAAFTCFTTTVGERLAWKYRHPRSYRLWMYDAGHYGQTFALACTALGLGPFQTAAFRDSALEQELGIAPEREFAAYVLGAGRPIRNEEGHPLSYRYPRPGPVRP